MSEAATTPVMPQRIHSSSGPTPFSPPSGLALVFIHKSGPMFRGIEGGVKISENNSVHVRSGRLNWVCVTERTHA
jgi:hypothetical protein